MAQLPITPNIDFLSENRNLKERVSAYPTASGVTFKAKSTWLPVQWSIRCAQLHKC